jgi:hypothetical protein
MAKYKVGDKVRIVNHRTIYMNDDGGMDKWLGKTMTIRKVEESVYRMLEDSTEYLGTGWYWRDNMISGLAEPEKPADENLSVTIRFCVRMTVAELYKNGKVVKVENARCKPKDEYSRAEGARIAVERLLQKKTEASKPKIGDKFVIVGNSPDMRHSFDIGTIVTLVLWQADGYSRYSDKVGRGQFVADRDVKPYREKTK